jgi:hypothetical protein
MLAVVNIVAGCTARKTMPVSPELALRNIDAAETVSRARRWISRLKTASEPKIPAANLYAGDAWQIIKPFGETYNLWAASAGYGLVNQRTPLCSYSATFTPNHPDSVLGFPRQIQPHQYASKWWTELGKWRKHNQSVSTVADLAKDDPCTPIIVILSPDYLRALHDDLCSARASLVDPLRLVIISAGARKNGELAENFIPCDARLQTFLRGGRASLNARIARKVLSETAPDKLHATHLKEKFARLLEKSPGVVIHNRTPMSDNAVFNFIAKYLRNRPRTSHSHILSVLRAEGLACERTRFKRLFQTTQQG